MSDVLGAGPLGPPVSALSAPAEPFQSQLDAANTALQLTPQERALYEMHLNNLTGPGGVDNPDGSRSSLFQLSFENDGRTYNVPSVWEGQILEPRAAIDRAVQYGLDKFPSYGSDEEAESRYDKMHQFMEMDTQKWLAGRQSPPQ